MHNTNHHMGGMNNNLSTVFLNTTFQEYIILCALE